ncbi:MAG: putative metal-binding motif-containing protein [Deltaproteobacteria bacterium]|nr:putative metal-binding motif-containing protein [Deltaproteobacteria bacterium]
MRAPVFALTLALLTFTACKESWTLGDGDGDGVLVTSGDCDDNNAEVNPDATEVWYNGVDENCDGNDADQDGDTFVDAAYVTAFPDWQTRFPLHAGFTEGDCWDDADDGSFLEEAVLDGLTLTPDLVSPNAEDAWYDGVDQDCDGANDFDQDGDGFDSANDEKADGSVGDDCVDGSPNDEVFEDSCSGELITVDPADAASVNPDATDTFYDGVDQNCDGADDNDADGDGYAVCNECDDTDPETFPSDIPEIWYDCADQNCDGNDGDRDGDGYVDAEYTASCADWATINPGKQDGDCWDDITDSDPDFTAINGNPKLDQADVHPDAEDIPYDAVDAACDGDTFEFDADQDGFDTDAYANRDNVRGDDCHDDIAAANPGATEECDADDIDHDCDGNLNDPSALGCVTFYTDVDKDTYGITTSQCLCEAEGTYTASNNDDCDDTKEHDQPRRHRRRRRQRRLQLRRQGELLHRRRQRRLPRQRQHGPHLLRHRLQRQRRGHLQRPHRRLQRRQQRHQPWRPRDLRLLKHRRGLRRQGRQRRPALHGHHPLLQRRGW